MMIRLAGPASDLGLGGAFALACWLAPPGSLRGSAGADRRLLTYGVASLAWSVLTVAFAVALSLRYYDTLISLAPPALVWTVLAAFYLLLALPLAAQLLRPLWTRVYRPRPEIAGP
jgi:hypothetical protein